MDQRRLRLGDILDDYCPRERRVTNHAVVAMVEEDVKQTRCTTCDAEHVYKGGKAPRRKKSDTTGALYKEVLAGISEQDAPSAAAPHAVSASHEHRNAESRSSDRDTIAAASAQDTVDAADRQRDDAIVTPDAGMSVDAGMPVDAGVPADAGAPVDAGAAVDAGMPVDAVMPVDEGPVHRPLIRAQLPRPEGLKIERQAPEFTIRQNTGRGGSFRGGDMRAGGRTGGAGNNGGGHRFGRGPHRGGGRSGGGANQGFGRGPGGPSRGPRKRSR